MVVAPAAVVAAAAGTAAVVAGAVGPDAVVVDTGQQQVFGRILALREVAVLGVLRLLEGWAGYVQSNLAHQSNELAQPLMGLDTNLRV